MAFPVFTLLLNIAPSVARNFSFAIQSIGMIAASLLIIGLRIPIEWNAMRHRTFGGVPGLLLSTYLLAPGHDQAFFCFALAQFRVCPVAHQPEAGLGCLRPYCVLNGDGWVAASRFWFYRWCHYEFLWHWN